MNTNGYESVSNALRLLQEIEVAAVVVYGIYDTIRKKR